MTTQLLDSVGRWHLLTCRVKRLHHLSGLPDLLGSSKYSTSFWGEPEKDQVADLFNCCPKTASVVPKRHPARVGRGEKGEGPN